jgi:Fe2+ or Zn2+ uptake regulation protein
MSLVNIENEQFRRDILTILNEDSDYQMGVPLLYRALDAIGNPIAHDRLDQQLAWLKDQGLVTVNSGEVVTVKLTAQGEDVALNRLSVPHIARPVL